MACSVVTWPEFGVGCGGKSELAKRILQAGIKAAAKLICLRGIDSISTVDGVFASFKAF